MVSVAPEVAVRVVSPTSWCCTRGSPPGRVASFPSFLFAAVPDMKRLKRVMDQVGRGAGGIKHGPCASVSTACLFCLPAASFPACLPIRWHHPYPTRQVRPYGPPRQATYRT